MEQQNVPFSTPDGSQGQPCGEVEAYASELTPGTNYQVPLFRNAADGSTTAVGRTAPFILTPVLP